MNRPRLTILMVLFVWFSGISQTTNWDKTIFEKPTQSNTPTVTINIDTYSENQIGAVKDDLIAFDEKVVSVIIKDELNAMLITYNSYMLLEDLIAVFRKNGFAYLLIQKGEGIDSKTEDL